MSFLYQNFVNSKLLQSIFAINFENLCLYRFLRYKIGNEIGALTFAFTTRGQNEKQN